MTIVLLQELSENSRRKEVMAQFALLDSLLDGPRPCGDAAG